MIKKEKYISEVIDSLIKSHKYQSILNNQVDLISNVKVEYTGSGLFAYFSFNNGIDKHEIDYDDFIINGVTIKSTDLEIEADAMIFINNGSIDYLEIWSKDGKYPERELTDYKLIKA